MTFKWPRLLNYPQLVVNGTKVLTMDDCIVSSFACLFNQSNTIASLQHTHSRPPHSQLDAMGAAQEQGTDAIKQAEMEAGTSGPWKDHNSRTSS